MISIEEAWNKITSSIQPLSTEVVALTQAQDRVLAQEVCSQVDLPPFSNSAMDGYALRAQETQGASEENVIKLSVDGEVPAGTWRDAKVADQTVTKIMTGAPVPKDCDSVLMLEKARLRGETVEIREPVELGKHVRCQGEDLKAGEVLAKAGVRLTTQRLGLLASAGIKEVTVYRAPSISLLATGSELVSAGLLLKPGQIYDSNRLVLQRLIGLSGGACHDLGVVKDDPNEIKQRIQQGLNSDLLMISGGVSVGAHDYVKTILKDLGVETVFWKVQMKPGKPIFCGRTPTGWVFGLPGNPISCVVGYLVFIEPLIRRLIGEANAKVNYQKAVLMETVHKKDDRTFYMTAQITPGEAGGLQATATRKQGSAMMQALSESNGFVVVPEACKEIKGGETVDVLQYQ